MASACPWAFEGRAPSTSLAEPLHASFKTHLPRFVGIEFTLFPTWKWNAGCLTIILLQGCVSGSMTVGKRATFRGKDDKMYSTGSERIEWWTHFKSGRMRRARPPDMRAGRLAFTQPRMQRGDSLPMASSFFMLIPLWGRRVLLNRQIQINHNLTYLAKPRPTHVQLETSPFCG